MSLPPPTFNHITVAAEKVGMTCVHIESNGTPEMTRVRLSDGRSLGLIQSVTWSMRLGEYGKLTVETLATPADLKALLGDGGAQATVLVRPAASYGPLAYLWDWSRLRARRGWEAVCYGCRWVTSWLYLRFTKPD